MPHGFPGSLWHGSASKSVQVGPESSITLTPIARHGQIGEFSQGFTIGQLGMGKADSRSYSSATINPDSDAASETGIPPPTRLWNALALPLISPALSSAQSSRILVLQFGR